MNKVSTSVRLNAILRTEVKDLCLANGISIGKAIETLLTFLKTDIDLQQRVFKGVKR
jgi:hypothetical protein